MFVATVPNRNSPPALLLRESYREGSKVRSRTLANLTHWAPEKIEALRHVLAGGRAALPLGDAFTISRSRPHGHVAAVLGTLRRLGLQKILDPRKSRQRELCVAMIVARLLAPCSKLATSRSLHEQTQQSSLGEALGLERASEDDLYEAMDGLLSRQGRIEQALARRHLAEGALALYDLSSTYFEGRHCPLAQRGYSRDGKSGTLQIVFGLLTNARGCPVAVEVFEGNTADPDTVGSQIRRMRERFHLQRVVLVGDRGVLTSARISEDLKPQGVDWITALRASAIRKLAEGGALQLGLFDARDLAEIHSPDYPGERLIVCRNPLLAAERSRKRQDLLLSTERELDKVVKATSRLRNPLRGRSKIALRVGAVLGRFKMAKHFRLHISEDLFRYERDEAGIAEQAALDGIYVIRTSVAQEVLGAEEAVRAYKSLASIERAFRSLKSVDLKVRPIYHREPDRVRAHVLLCTLAYYVEWHMREALAPILFDDEDKEAGERLRSSVVAPAQRSPQAKEKARQKRTAEDLPVQSFQTLMRDLATIVKNRIEPKGKGLPAFDVITSATPLQKRALELLGVPITL